MSDYSHAELQQLAIDHADALCEHLSGQWHRTESLHAEASIAHDGCELHLCAYEQNGTARVSIQAQLPQGWGVVEGITPPEITVAADRGAEAIAADVARRLLPAHAEIAARVHTALEREAQRQAMAAAITEHFLASMPGAVPDLHSPATAVSSAGGPDRFSASLRVGREAATADLHLRNTPIGVLRTVVDLLGRQLGDTEQSTSTPGQVLGQMADAVTGLASERHSIPIDGLLRETALNVLILSRIVSNRLDSPAGRERIERFADELVTELRSAARHH
ncbi:hypothetical protein [Glycomyces salinus]|uniref:hypothetical protein n=1 Tax=Glycomyces salinus TaxID=980294 RepID=UPI0018EE1313|nr:hypothetical protein [Glycomyces salinus]